MKQRRMTKATVAFLILILAVGFLIRLDFFLARLHNFTMTGDSQNYLIMSRQLVDNGVYGYALGQKSILPNAYVTPRYPLLLAGAYAVVHDPYLQVTVVRFLQVIVGGVLSPLLAFLLLRRLFRRNAAAMITALFTAIYPTYILSSVYILTEVFSLAAMLLYLYLQIVSLQIRSRGIGVLAGIAFAGNVLIRPTMLPLFALPFLFCFFLWKRIERTNLVKLFAFSIFGFVLLMLPWWVRNMISLHRFILLSSGSGDPFLAGTYPYMTGLFQDYLASKPRLSESAYAWKRIFDGFVHHPLTYLKWYTVGKIGYLFETPWIYWNINPSYYGYLVYSSHFFLHYFFIRFGVIGTFAGFMRKSPVMYTAIYGFAFLGLLLLFIPERRYAYHILFFLMVSSSYAICTSGELLAKAWQAVRRRFRPVKAM